MLLYYSLAAALPLLSPANAQAAASSGTLPSDIVGTWSTKSNKTLTGPGFYNPVADKLIEPDRTGISYSFTSDGFYEEAYYRAIANPTDPNCPGAIMQWQHGSWNMQSNGSLILNPIEVDGRQLLSEPCTASHSVYSKYNNSEMMQRYLVSTDKYHNIPRLDIFKFDGSPLQPMYKVFSPPQMLPTTTLHPPSASATGTAPASNKMKRGLDTDLPLSWKLKLQQDGQAGQLVHRIDADRLWWAGLAMTGVGAVMYLGPRRMGWTRS